jgi:hypothetical protein
VSTNFLCIFHFIYKCNVYIPIGLAMHSTLEDRDTYNSPRRVLMDSPFSVGTHQSFQILHPYNDRLTKIIRNVFLTHQNKLLQVSQLMIRFQFSCRLGKKMYVWLTPLSITFQLCCGDHTQVSLIVEEYS